MRPLSLILIIALSSFCQDLIYSSTDTLYTTTNTGPNEFGKHAAIRKGNTWDIRRMRDGVKVSTITIPPHNYISAYNTITQKWIDADDGWELVINHIDTTVGNSYYIFKVYDDNSTVILEGDGWAYLYYEETSTYLYSNNPFKIWRFRTDVISISPENGNKPNRKISVNMIPRPDVLTLEFNAGENGRLTGLKIMNTLGRTVYEGKSQDFNAGKNRIPIDISKLANGVYFPEVILNGQSCQGKFSKLE